MTFRRHVLLRLHLAASSLPLALLVAPPAWAEIPQTTAEWLELIAARRRDIYTVRIESAWQRLEDGQVVEEWEQSLTSDDLGGRLIEERGRTSKGRTAIDPTTVTDVLFAFNGAQYRELTKVWTISPKELLTPERKAALRSESPVALTGWLEAEPGEGAAINERTTPLRMADHWFTVCLVEAAKERLEPKVSAMPDEPGRHLVELDSAVPQFGHKCRAVVDEGQGLRVVRLEMWDVDRWSERFEIDYVEKEGRWLIAAGRDLSWFGNGKDRRERELRFRVLETSVGATPENDIELPGFPVGTRVTDRLTNAVYRVGRDHDVERDIGGLVATAREQHAGLLIRQSGYFAWPTQLRLGLLYAAAGALTAVALSGLAYWVPWLRLRAMWTRTKQGGQGRTGA